MATPAEAIHRFRELQARQGKPSDESGPIPPKLPESEASPALVAAVGRSLTGFVVAEALVVPVTHVDGTTLTPKEKL